MQAIFLQIISKIAYPIINKRALPSKVETLATHDQIQPNCRCRHNGILTVMMDDGRKSLAYKRRQTYLCSKWAHSGWLFTLQSLIIKLQNVNELYSVRVTDGRPVKYIVLNQE